MRLTGTATPGQSGPGMVLYYDMSTIVGYLLPNHIYTCILHIYDL